VRLFVAIPLPPEIAASAASLTPDLGFIRPVRAELLHLTLAFLGRVADERLDEAVAAVGEATRSRPAYAASLTRAGRFPLTGRPHVVWLGLADGAAESEQIATAVRDALAARALPFDNKPFRPHVTIGRVREDADRAQAIEVSAALRRLVVPPMRWGVREVVLFDSRLSPRGPTYTARARIQLAANAG
jgi:2'-5' RNA ligase